MATGIYYLNYQKLQKIEMVCRTQPVEVCAVWPQPLVLRRQTMTCLVLGVTLSLSKCGK